MNDEINMPQREQGYVLTEQEGQPIWFLGNLSTMKAKSEQTQNSYGMYVALVAPGSSPFLLYWTRWFIQYWTPWFV